MSRIQRRELLTGLGSLLLMGTAVQTNEAAASNVTEKPDDSSLWKYAKIDPTKVADTAYEIYPQGACMYAVTRSLLTHIASALRPIDLVAAMTIESFPFHMMRYGHGGIGAVGSTCGAFNGGAAIIGLFVQDAVLRDAMIRELCLYYENTALPQYKPKDDTLPKREAVVSESVLCHISSSRWCAESDSKMFGPGRIDRCRRLSADIAAQTAELLNRLNKDKTCAFASLPEPTKTCFECHGPKGDQADSIGISNCATCHEHDELHSNKYIKIKKL